MTISDERGAEMAGFDPKWRDPADYIIGITKQIWEDRNIASLHQNYARDMPVRSPSSLVIGNQGVIAATMATLAEFPDRSLLGEDVIWSAYSGGGFLSSHRLLSTATHSRDGAYGKATGTRLTYRIVADCAARGDTIYDEWLIRDQGAIVRQMGWSRSALPPSRLSGRAGRSAASGRSRRRSMWLAVMTAPATTIRLASAIARCSRRSWARTLPSFRASTIAPCIWSCRAG